MHVGRYSEAKALLSESHDLRQKWLEKRKIDTEKEEKEATKRKEDLNFLIEEKDLEIEKEMFTHGDLRKIVKTNKTSYEMNGSDKDKNEENTETETDTERTRKFTLTFEKKDEDYMTVEGKTVEGCGSADCLTESIEGKSR